MSQKLRQKDLDQAFLCDMQSEGYYAIKQFDDGTYVGLLDFLFTTGLVCGLNPIGYQIRYCYEHRHDAEAAIDSWDGVGDPPGPWIKAKGVDSLGVKRDDLNPAFCDPCEKIKSKGPRL